MAYQVSFKGEAFRADAFHLRVWTPAGAGGTPGAQGTKVSMHLYVMSEEPANMSQGVRKALFGAANHFGVSSDRNGGETLKVTVLRQGNDGEHVYLASNAWLRFYEEAQQLRRNPDKVTVSFAQPEPGLTLEQTFEVAPGENVPYVQMHLEFVGFLTEAGDVALQ